MYPDPNAYDPNNPYAPKPADPPASQNARPETAYGAPPPAGSNPNNNYNYNPYGPPPPQAPYEPTQAGVPSAPYNNPYASPPPAIPPGGNPYQYPNNVQGPYGGANMMTPPPRKSSSMGKMLLIALAVVLVLGGIVAAIAIPAHNSQVAKDNANATATVQTQNAAATAHANATATVRAQATATAIASTYPFSANLKLDDTLADNNHGNGWIANSFCSFTGGTYHAMVPGNTIGYASCYAQKTNFTDFTYQVTMQLIKGDFAGITFRGDGVNSKRYAFVINQKGECVLLAYTQDKNPKTLYDQVSTAFDGTKQLTMGVVARGGKITVYVNQKEITTTNDSTFGSGQIGVISYNVGTAADAAFSNAKVWQL